MTYSLENKNEFVRLETQSRTAHYDYRHELSGLSIKPGMNVLDAGCGSGIVSRFLAESNPGANVVGVDASEDRVQQAASAAKGIKNLSFRAVDLSRGPIQTSSGGGFDVIVCRFVLQHLRTGGVYERVLKHLHQSLKPGGLLCVVEVDGFLLGLSPMPRQLKKAIHRWECKGPVDLKIGRRMPALMKAAGLEQIEVRADAHVFQGAELKVEAGLMKERFQHAAPALTKVLGSRRRYVRFCELFLSSMMRPDGFYHHTIFVVVGKRPEQESNIKLIK